MVDYLETLEKGVIDGYCACFDYGDDLMLIVRIRILDIQIMAYRRAMENG
ncbi:MAG: hypothetical protein ACI9SQ_000775 [Rubritalea sp.]|jgi:hypothetical protein